MKITIRPERREDYKTVEELTRDAFWGFSTPACDEHLLAHKLRKIPAFVPELDFVAETDGKIVGNIMYTKSKVVGGNGIEHEVLTFGPLSVLPDYQGMGVGSALVKHTVSEARRLGYRAILIFGHPDYYTRFGFKRAGDFNITTSAGKNFDAFMALELVPDALKGVTGRFYEDPVFEIDTDETAEFEKSFPPKEKRLLTPIGVLLEKLEPAAREAFAERKIEHLVVLYRYSGREIAAWAGIGEKEKVIINTVLVENGFAPKIFG